MNNKHKRDHTNIPKLCKTKKHGQKMERKKQLREERLKRIENAKLEASRPIIRAGGRWFFGDSLLPT